MIDGKYIGDLMATNAFVGVPYSDEMLEAAQADFRAQAARLTEEVDYDG